MTDDAIREVHGMACANRTTNERSSVVVREGEDFVFIDSLYVGVKMTPWQARYLAAKLYRLARRINNREKKP